VTDAAHGGEQDSVMTSPVSPTQARSLIIERLVGDSGDSSQVIGAGRSMAERALPLINKRLSGEIGAPVTADLQAVEVGRVAEARARAGETFAMTVVASSISSDAMTMVMDGSAVTVMVCALFGGDPDQSVAPIERDLSQVEIDVATLVFQEIAQILNGTGRRSLDLKLPLPRAIAGGEAERRALRDGPAVRIVFGLSTPTDTGSVTVVIPQRVLLVRNGADAEAGNVSEWHAHFSEEVMRSTIALEATMPLARLTLGQLAGLREGEVLEIEEAAQTRAHLSARDKTLFVCEFGKLGSNYTVRIKHTYDAGQDFIDGLLPG
jgi:flagellar motor switch protein FliM